MTLTLTATPQPSTGSVALAVAGAASAATNLLPNPSFEPDATEWAPWGGATVITVRPHPNTADGANVLRVTTGNTTNSGAAIAVSATPGATYGARASVRNLTATMGLYARLQFLSSTGASLAVTDGPLASPAPSAFITLSLTATAPAGAAQVRLLIVRQDAGPNGADFDLDAVLLRRVQAWETFDPAQYFAGTRSADVVLTRTDINGTAPVRRSALLPANGVLTVRDHEVSLRGEARYTVTDSAGNSASAGPVTFPAGGSSRLHAVQYPALVTAPPNVIAYDATRESATVVHWPQGRQDPVVIAAPARLRQGSLTAYYASHAAALAAQAILELGRPMQLRQGDHAGMDMFLRVTRSRLTPLDLTTDGWSWAVEMDYVETRRPQGVLLGGDAQ